MSLRIIGMKAAGIKALVIIVLVLAFLIALLIIAVKIFLFLLPVILVIGGAYYLFNALNKAKKGKKKEQVNVEYKIKS